MRPTKDIAVWIGIIVCFIILIAQMLYSMPSHKHELIWNNLTKQQKEYAQLIYEVGYEHTLSLTLIAISWEESRLGLVQENRSDGKYGSYGLMHILLETYMNLYKIKNTPENRERVKENLKKYPNINIDAAITILYHFRDYFAPKNSNDIVHLDEITRIYSSMIKAYNCGYNIKRPACDRYYKNVLHQIELLERQIKADKNIVHYLAYNILTKGA